jgi:hypothetical protein
MDHFMKTIAVKQQILDFAGPRDWMASFLDFQISKIEDHCVEIRTGIDAPVSAIKREPIWN